MFGISDARLGGRIYQFGVGDAGGSLQVTTLKGMSLSMAPWQYAP